MSSGNKRLLVLARKLAIARSIRSSVVISVSVCPKPPGLVDATDARPLADRVTDCFAESFRLDGTDVTVGTSVGIAVHDPASGRTAEQLLREADAAMYRHKERGRSSVRSGA